MPELPEVETIVRQLRRPLIGRTFSYSWTDWPRQIVTPDPAGFNQRLANQTITAIERRAKYLLFSLSEGDTLLIHLKMSGQLAVVPAGEPRNKHTHVIFGFTDGDQLRFTDTRKFGRVYLVKEPADILGQLGPEPLHLSFTADLLQTLLAKRQRTLKPLLLDQTFIAGIGNIYADEALFYAGLHPGRNTATLTPAEITRLHAAIQKALTLGIDHQGATISMYRQPDGRKGQMQNEFVVYDRRNQPCKQCQTPIQQLILGGRTTHFCPQCQARVKSEELKTHNS